jgi:integrase
VSSTKTEGSRRQVSIPAFLAEELARHLATQSLSSDDDLVFTAPQGGPLSRTVFRNRVWVPAVRKAGIERPPRFHDLRHTGVAMAIKAGAHPKTIQAWVGHASIKTTMDVYGHLYDEAEQELADRLDAIRAEALSAGARVVSLPR